MAAPREVKIKVRAYDHRALDQSVREVIATAQRTGAVVKGPIPLPVVKKRWTLLRSPHVNKDAQDAFEMRQHARLIVLQVTTQETALALSELHLAAGVDVHVKYGG